MRQVFDFVKTTALGGAIFLLPFAAALLVVVTGKVVRCRKFVAPPVNPEWPLYFTNAAREREALSLPLLARASLG